MKSSENEDEDSYDDEISDGIPGVAKEELEAMIQEAIKTFKTEFLEGKDLKPLLDATKAETLEVVRKEFDQEELKAIVQTNIES